MFQISSTMLSLSLGGFFFVDLPKFLGTLSLHCLNYRKCLPSVAKGASTRGQEIEYLFYHVTN